MNALIRRSLVAVLLMSLSSVAHAAPPCSADLDGDGNVGTTDLIMLLGEWGDCGVCLADMNGDGVIDPTDLIELLGNWGPAVFDYGPPLDDEEAEQIAIEMLGVGGDLRPSAEIYQRIDRDLDLIHKAVADLVSEPHSPVFVANQMLLILADDDFSEDFICLNEFYQVTKIDEIVDNLNIYLITFIDGINIPALSLIYMEAEDVDIAEPNWIFGGENFWTPVDLGKGVWQWTIDDGWLDCFDGCDCHREYTIQTDADGNVEIIDIVEFGQPWCEFDE